jgi:hypothetical protein
VDESIALDELARDVSRVEALRAVKDLQRRYAHLALRGEWDAMAALFCHAGEVRCGAERMVGRPAIAAWLASRAGAIDGKVPGSLHVELIDQPVAHLSADGQHAIARWMTMSFLGDGKGRARIEGGLCVNDYVRAGAGWRLNVMSYHRQYAGDYAEGWTNVGGTDLPIVPFHFTSEEAGIPIPPAIGDPAPFTQAPEELARRIQRLKDEDAVRNLQNACNYYVDRRMWADVLDLFAENCAAQIGNELYYGTAGVRRALETMGSEGLSEGELNERLIFDLIVDVLPSGTEAHASGIELGLLAGRAHPTGSWAFRTFRNRFVKEAGLWRLKELRTRALLEASYETGWGHVAAAAAIDSAEGPLTGRAPPPLAITSAKLPDMQRKLMRSAAFDGVENVSSAYGFYLDDFQWADLATIFARKGNKQSPFAGYYLGRERIAGAASASWGPAPTMRGAISFHWRTQPVIHVSQDGRSANLRTRLFQPRTSKNPNNSRTGFYMGGLHGGMYPNDQAVLEEGVWRLWSLTIDEHYFYSPDWVRGWAGATKPEIEAPSPASKLLTIYPPDVAMSELGRRAESFRGGTGKEIVWPGILPMWFHYSNPVSGREPELFWPDCVPSELLPASRMTQHGYQQPPANPEVDEI